MNKNFKHIESAFIHGGADGDNTTGAVNVPIYQTSTYRQPELGKNKGYEYSRTSNPTRAALEALSAELEAGTAGFAFASGMAAISAVLMLFHAGDKVLISRQVYGGTFRVLDKVFNAFELKYEIVDTHKPEQLTQHITPDVKAIFIESPANPLLTVTDIRAVADMARENHILTIVDNTFMTPYLQRPLELGADIVIHSATKYLGGHCDVVAGLVVVKSDHLSQRLAFIQNATGGILQPFDAFLLIRGIKTLSVRLDRQVENAQRIALYLKHHPAVARVYYPGLPDSPDYELQKRQAKNGGAMISFELKPNYHYDTFFKSLHLIALAESLGGVESLVCHPATMTHASIPPQTRLQMGISDYLIRLSVGIEHIDDLLNDIAQAIDAAEA